MRTLLRNRPFRRLVAGRLVTNAGDSLYSVAAMWLVYDLTGSSTYTGLAGFLTLLPQTLQFLTGPFVDRWSLRRVLVVTQVLQGLLVLLIPLAAWTGTLSVWIVLTVMPLAALLNQFVYPAQNAALPRIVDGDDLVAANSALTVAYQGVDTLFNALAGLLIAAVGAVTLYLVDSVTFAAAAILFASLRLPATSAESASAGDGVALPTAVDGGVPAADSEGEKATGLRSHVAAYLRDLRAGFAFVRRTDLAKLLVAGVIANATLGGTMAVLPAFAAHRGGPSTYGILLAAIAGGVFAGALIASVFDHLPYGALSIGAFSLGAACWAGALASHWLPVTALLFLLAFVPVGITNVVGMALFQRLVPDSLLGRVMALGGSIGTAMMPAGSLLGGIAADTMGPTVVVAAGGLGMLSIAIYVAVVPALRTMPAVNEVTPLSVDDVDLPSDDTGSA